MGRKQRKTQKKDKGQDQGPMEMFPMTYFFKVCPTSESFHYLPKDTMRL
jgi:hypothetical protein